MRCVNCLCGARREAVDEAAIFDAFWGHTDTAHADIKVSPSRREDVAGALRRSGGWDGARSQIAGGIEVRPLSPAMRSVVSADSSFRPIRRAYPVCVV